MIPAERAHLFIAADSHPGMSGKSNEDRYAVSAFRTSQGTENRENHTHHRSPRSVVFAILADGIGGHQAGEVAAETAVELISQAISTSDGSQPLSTLCEAIFQASQTIQQLSEANDSVRGMGSTCACSLIIGNQGVPGSADRVNQLYIAYVGDSRIYLIRDKQIQQLTIDHTWLQEAIQAGILTNDQARGHPNTHIIHRYLGSRQPVETDTRLRLHDNESDEQMKANQGMHLHPGDHLVMCSDGLTDLVQDHEILLAFQQNKQKAAIATLIELSNSRGGHDNITIVALQVPGKLFKRKPLPASFLQRQARRKQKLTWLGIALTALITGILILAGWFALMP